MKDSTTVRRLVGWAEAERDVRAIFLVGSRGEPDGEPDRLSDYDVLIFVRDRSSYESGERWLTSFGPILVKLHESYDLLGTTVATRLVQYRDGARIDFSICDVSLLERITEQPELPKVLDRGYRVLVDKDDRASRLPESSGSAYSASLPSERDYQAVVNEFLWEALYVAKHLARGELLPALYSSECVIRFQCLVPMLKWRARAAGSTAPIGPHGRGLIRELDSVAWDRLQQTFPGSSIDEEWEALFAMTACFRDASSNVADHFGFARQQELADGVEALLLRMKDARPDTSLAPDGRDDGTLRTGE